MGSRVQTQFSVAEGGDGNWYAGTLSALHAGARATVVFDDGDEATAPLASVYTIRDDDAADEGGRDAAAPPVVRGRPVP